MMPSTRYQNRAVRLVTVLCIAACGALLIPSTATAQNLTGQTDVNQLLQQFGPLLGLTGTGTGGITTDPGTTPTQPISPTPPPTTPGDGLGPQPTIVTNQFTTTSGGSLNARRPGLMIQRSIAIQSGAVTLPGNGEGDESFFSELSMDIALTILDTFSGILNTVSTALGFADFFNPGGGGGGGQNPFPNAATTGGGTTTQIQ